MATTPTPTASTTAPPWRQDPYGWCLWYLRKNGHIYRAFRKEVDDRLARYPRSRVSADAVLHYIRWNTPINAEGDLFSINDHASALFARIYLVERPQHAERFELRRSFLDYLTRDQVDELLVAAEDN